MYNVLPFLTIVLTMDDAHICSMSLFLPLGFFPLIGASLQVSLCVFCFLFPSVLSFFLSFFFLFFPSFSSYCSFFRLFFLFLTRSITYHTRQIRKIHTHRISKNSDAEYYGTFLAVSPVTVSIKDASSI